MSTNYHWDTQALPPGQGAKLWTQAISQSFQHVQTQCYGQNFHGTLRSQRLGEVAINRLTAQPYRVSTSRPQTDQPWLFLNVHQQGHCRLIQNGREQWLPAGSLSLNVGTSPFTLDFLDEVTMTTLRLPLDGLLPDAEREEARELPLRRQRVDREHRELLAALAGGRRHLRRAA